MRLILYSKPGCHLCEGLQEKLEQIQSPQFDLEVRDITTRDDWFQAYQYEIPVLFVESPQPSGNSDRPSEGPAAVQSPSLTPIPRPSPRASVQQLSQMLQKYLSENLKNSAE